ncbi:glycosyltransferase [Paenibacillus sp. UNC499MF]|uniref:glycosyltransferase n=1 Tax=Paenibacillus sp. UNC499MF TaxID=1502751 RepID=UPI00089F8EED|nr:glycosyltransferase [Paenibacillus sp. UNC499MF]SEG36550.1 Glycosyltransferase involved in cell wall bisynthesis [Paenibacillus sp. UNC499MF]
MLPKVTVVIPFYNCPYVDQAVSSVLNQTYTNIELIVVDDGSTQHKDKLKPYMDRLIYIGKENGGAASALNMGFALATGDYVAWLSSDDLFYPDKIGRQVQFMLERNSIFSHTAFDQINEAGAVTQANVASRYRYPHEFTHAFLSICPVNGCTVMMRRDLFGTVGYFDETLRYTQDYEFWIRVLLAGFPLDFLDAPLTLYRLHGGMGTMLYQPAIWEEVLSVRSRYRPYLLQHSRSQRRLVPGGSRPAVRSRKRPAARFRKQPAKAVKSCRKKAGKGIKKRR